MFHRLLLIGKFAPEVSLLKGIYFSQVAGAKLKLYTHQKKLSEIEAKVDLEHPIFFARIKVSRDY